MAGFRKVFAQRNGSFSALRVEYIDAGAPSLGRHRAEGGVYIHTVLRQGHTEGGQLLGAPVGVGSFEAETIAWERYTRDGRSSWYVERTSQNNSTSFLTSGTADYGASDLTGSFGYERYRIRPIADISYGVAATAAKRAATLPREVNLTFHVQITPHNW